MLWNLVEMKLEVGTINRSPGRDPECQRRRGAAGLADGMHGNGAHRFANRPKKPGEYLAGWTATDFRSMTKWYNGIFIPLSPASAVRQRTLEDYKRTWQQISAARSSDVAATWHMLFSSGAVLDPRSSMRQSAGIMGYGLSGCQKGISLS